MMAQSEIERERYEARRKAQMDHDWIIKSSKAESRAEGLAQGEKIGAIHVYERLLNKSETPREQLQSITLEELTRMADALRMQIEARS